MNAKDMVLHELYQFEYGAEILKYTGKRGNWHQFEKLGEWGVWAELLDADLHLIKKYEPSI